LQTAFNKRDAFPRVLLAQSAVGREGLNLHKACRVVVQLHAEWNPAILEQQLTDAPTSRVGLLSFSEDEVITRFFFSGPDTAGWLAPPFGTYTQALVGPPNPGRSVRIMVTMPSTAAHDEALVATLVAAGMDIAVAPIAHATGVIAGFACAGAVLAWHQNRAR
jgi:hypothetical protein